MGFYCLFNQKPTNLEDFESSNIKNTNEEVLPEFGLESLVTHVQNKFKQLLKDTLTKSIDTVFYLK